MKDIPDPYGFGDMKGQPGVEVRDTVFFNFFYHCVKLTLRELGEFKNLGFDFRCATRTATGWRRCVRA
jgi:hypothetical protein